VSGRRPPSEPPRGGQKRPKKQNLNFGFFCANAVKRTYLHCNSLADMFSDTFDRGDCTLERWRNAGQVPGRTWCFFWHRFLDDHFAPAFPHLSSAQSPVSTLTNYQLKWSNGKQSQSTACARRPRQSISACLKIGHIALNAPRGNPKSGSCDWWYASRRREGWGGVGVICRGGACRGVVATARWGGPTPPPRHRHACEDHV
jgi:hypothetical protein